MTTSERADALPRATRRSGADEAYLLLRTVFTIAPIAFGLDKFAQVLSDWDYYLAPWINDLVPGSAHDAMMIVGVVEVIAGVLVALRPRVGAYVVALWLGGIIVDLVTLASRRRGHVSRI
jgi:hypothetical protein